MPLAITRTFRPWTHTSDDSYIYQLSLVVATATLSYICTYTNLSIIKCNQKVGKKNHHHGPNKSVQQRHHQHFFIPVWLQLYHLRVSLWHKHTTGRERNNAPTGRVERNWTMSGEKAPWHGFLLGVELAQLPHYLETRTFPGGYLHRAWSFGIRPDRHAHEPGSSSASCCCNGSVGSIETQVPWYLIRGSVGAKALLFPMRRRKINK